MQNQTKPEPLRAPMAKLILVVAIIVCLGAVAGVAGYCLTKKKPIVSPTPKTISAIEISADKKLILNSKTKEVIFTIKEAEGYFDNMKYSGDCFEDIKLSNNKNRIVFSTSCLSKDTREAWIGIHDLPLKVRDNKIDIIFNTRTMIEESKKPSMSLCRFLTGGSGRNFVWSQDDKTITYEADLGLSGLTETRTIDSVTGEILTIESEEADIIAEKIDSQNILSDKEVYEILREFAVKPNAADISDGNILLDAIKFQNENIEERLKKIEYDLEESGKFLADAIDARGIVNAKTKVCVARSVIYDNFKHVCDLKEDSFVSTDNVDDILATEEIIPYFLAGFAYFKDGDYAKATHYLNQVKLHRQAEIDRWKEDYFLEIRGEIYEKIYNKTIKVLNEIEIADWQTYRNEEFGFEVKYPKIFNPDVNLILYDWGSVAKMALLGSSF